MAEQSEHAFACQGEDGPARRTRYRCSACGNLTRFDAVLTRRSRAFFHYTLAGDLTVESDETLSTVVEDISCRWCGTGDAVTAIDAGGS